MLLPTYVRLHDQTLRARLATLRSAVEPILAGNYLAHFTDHSVTHPDRLCDLVDRLTDPCPSTNQLSEAEAFILYSACYLHDVGMQHQKAGETEIIGNILKQAEYSGKTWVDLDIPMQRKIVREVHHRISWEMIRQSIDAPQPTVLGIQLTTEWNPGQIASVCLAHGLNFESAEYSEHATDWGTLRMSLLCALLRLSDILDESRNRSCLYLERTRQLDLESRMHWWRHYYVADVQIDPGAHSIVLWFDFPPQRRDNYREMILPLQVPVLEEELSRHYAVLAHNNMLWHLQTRDVPAVQSTAVLMDNELELFLVEKLHRKKEEQAERDRLLVLNQLKVARPVIERALCNLRNQSGPLTVDNKLLEFLRLAKQLWRLGGHRDAWMLLWTEYGRIESSASPKIRLEVALELADMMLADGHSEHAARLLHQLREIAASLPQTEQLRLRFITALGRAYLDQCAYEQAFGALNEASQLSPNSEERSKIEAEISETKMLLGTFAAEEQDA